MSADPASSSPGRAAPPVLARHRHFLEDIRIDHGPRDTLGRLFLKADTELRRVGLELSFAPVAAMPEVNAMNRDSWLSLFPTLDPRFGGFTDENGFCMLARNVAGDVVAAQAARLYDLGDRSIKDATEALELWYPDPAGQRSPGERCAVTCPSAPQLTGRCVFSGGVWYRPDYRRLGLSYTIGRVVKAYAYTCWRPDIAFCMMQGSVLDGGTARRAGFTHAEWAVEIENMRGLGALRLALLWMTADDHLAYFGDYLEPARAKVDAAVDARSA